MNIAVIGTGYVGLSTATAFAELGNNVIATDVDQKKIDGLNNGIMPIFEPGLKEMVDRNVKEGRLSFSTDNKKATKQAEVIFICVGTPPKESGETELKFVLGAAQEIAETMDSYKIIVHKSTVPVQTGLKVKKLVAEKVKEGVEFDVISNPEFLREGTAMTDTLQPERIVIGSDSERATEIIRKLYSPIKAPFIVTDIQSAELIKHASNSFLAMKISFINALADICEASGADVEKVAEGMGFDTRIGRAFLNAGIGYGGFCFPKDVQAFIKIAEQLGIDFKLLKATHEINVERPGRFVEKIKQALGDLSGKKIGVWGLAFKPNTDDMRFAPSIPILTELQSAGATIQAYDPEAMEKAKLELPNITYVQELYQAVEGADCLLILTEWNEFKEADLKKIKKLLTKPIIIDGRNIYHPEDVRSHGITYHSMGR